MEERSDTPLFYNLLKICQLNQAYVPDSFVTSGKNTGVDNFVEKIVRIWKKMEKYIYLCVD